MRANAEQNIPAGIQGYSHQDARRFAEIFFLFEEIRQLIFQKRCLGPSQSSISYID